MQAISSERLSHRATLYQLIRERLPIEQKCARVQPINRLQWMKKESLHQWTSFPSTHEKEEIVIFNRHLIKVKHLLVYNKQQHWYQLFCLLWSRGYSYVSGRMFLAWHTCHSGCTQAMVEYWAKLASISFWATETSKKQLTGRIKSPVFCSRLPSPAKDGNDGVGVSNYSQGGTRCCWPLVSQNLSYAANIGRASVFNDIAFVNPVAMLLSYSCKL